MMGIVKSCSCYKVAGSLGHVVCFKISVTLEPLTSEVNSNDHFNLSQCLGHGIHVYAINIYVQIF